MFALRHADVGLEVGGIEEVGGAGDDPVDFAARFAQFVLAMQGAGDPGAGPGEFVVLQNAAIGLFGTLGIAAIEQHFGALAEDFEAVGAAGFAIALGFEDGQGRGIFLFALFLVVLLEELLLGHDAVKAQHQLVRREGLDDVVVRDQFDGGDHLFIGLLAGHHHENAFVGEQVEATQFLQQLLAGTPLAEHVIAQDDVRHIVADAVDGVLVIGGEFDGKGADGLGDGAQGVAGRRLVVDDQETLAGETVVHGRRRVKRAPPSALSLVSVRLPCRPWRTCISASEAASSRPVPLLGGICG